MAFAVNTLAPPAWRVSALQAGGVRVAAFAFGSAAVDAPAVVLVHGLGHWSEGAWGRLAPYLDPSLRYLAFDLPGFGASERPKAPYDVPYFAAVLGAVVDVAGLARFALVGHSLGGCIAAAYAGDHPAQVTHLGLIAPAGFGRTPRHLAYGLAAILARPVLTRLPFRGFVQPGFRRAVVDADAIDAPTLDRAYAMFADRNVRDAFARVYAGVPATFARRRHLHARWARYTGPAFCAWGRHDRYIALSALRDVLRVYPHATTLVLERSGHLAMLEEPERLGAALRAFLAGAA
jgi:pimeloyl-ACP methyl ester carboxylesterase